MCLIPKRLPSFGNESDELKRFLFIQLSHTVVVKRQSLQKSQLTFLVIVLKRDGFVPQWLELMEEESSLCFAFCPTESDFQLLNPSQNCWKFKGKKGVVAGQETASRLKSGPSQWNSMSSKSDTWYPLVSISVVRRHEGTSALKSCFHCRFGLIRKWVKKLGRKSYSWDTTKFCVASRISRQLIVF